jgi:hypothetical protein
MNYKDDCNIITNFFEFCIFMKDVIGYEVEPKFFTAEQLAELDETSRKSNTPRLYACAGASATARLAACGNLLPGPMTKVSNVL